ncbi:hypothetical protein [Merismopedia glauca]|uniref:hypothetical protein n=1 Tax=Merismopedia glauca TaxID=292586 RepID=UPI0015E7531B|nr:hypothetical protein [Merismopedia glauca]
MSILGELALPIRYRSIGVFLIIERIQRKNNINIMCDRSPNYIRSRKAIAPQITQSIYAIAHKLFPFKKQSITH